MNLRQKINNDYILKQISETFDYQIYLVGGAVRDFLFNKEIFDRDLIVCDCEAGDFAQKLAKLFNATFVPLDEENKIYRVVMNDKINIIDVTNPINNSLSDDLARRDLTINAVAVDLHNGEIVDPQKGIIDFENRQIKHISEENFIDDPLRLLRVFRFQACTGFELSSELLPIIKKHCDLICLPARERVLYEIMKMFDGEYVHLALIKMDEACLLDKIFPFVAELKLVPKNSHHHLDLFDHSIETVKQISNLFYNSSEQIRQHLNSIDFGGFSRISHLRFAGFLHDIGKYSTWTIENERHRFIKHDDVGSKIANDLLKKMSFSNKQIVYLTNMIKFHIYPSQVVASEDVTEKIMMRYIRKRDADSIDNILLAMADRLSAKGPEITQEMIEKNLTGLRKLLEFYLDKGKTLQPLPKLLDGNDIMKLLNIKPSPLLGEILEALHEAQLDGNVTCQSEAVNFVKNYKL